VPRTVWPRSGGTETFPKTWRYLVVIHSDKLGLPFNLILVALMADYYPLISEAVAGLSPHAPRGTRRIVYERARDAQLSQLRIVSPPLSEAEITHERLALEDAIRKVERKAAKRDVSAADEANGRSPIVEGETIADSSPHAAIIGAPLMILTGTITGRFVSFWRWRAAPPRSQIS
jgi:hypothetical protein